MIGFTLVDLPLITVAADAEDGRVIEVLTGNSLEGWTRDDGQPVTNGWSVKDGVLRRGDKRCGHIYLPGEYGDFELRFSWKLPAKGNSGLNDLLGGPFGVGTCGSVEEDNLSVVVTEDDENVQNAERGRGKAGAEVELTVK